MPRFKLANNKNYFDQLFRVIQFTDNEVGHAAWTLLRTATTNPVLYQKVVALDHDPNFNWEDIFEGENIYRLLYVL
jgi:hypothetical protein